MGSTLLPVLGALITSVPVFVVEVLIIVLAVSRWPRHPRVSMLAITAMVVTLVVEVLTRTASVLLPMRPEQGHSAAALGVTFAVLGGLSSLAHALALGLLAAALFSDRGALHPAER